MNRLTNEQIQFIDNYLYNAGVHYVDIRCEMTDHVATAIEDMEGEFGYNFSRYMAVHKRELMASNRSFRKKAFGTAVRILFKNCVKPVFLVGTTLFTALAFLLTKAVGYSEVSDALMIGHLVAYFCLYFSWIYFWMFKKNRYSVIDRLLLVSFFLPVLNRFEKNIENETLMLVFLSLYTAFEIALIYTVLQFHKQYKVRFDG
ncbi:hypothetical protein ACX0HA_09690 [Flavobacterium hauense]